MTTSNMTSTTDAGGMFSYCLYTKVETDKKTKKGNKQFRLDKSKRRDIGTLSTFLHDVKDLDGILAELKLSAGRKYDAIHNRISPAPEDMAKLTTLEQQKQFFAECAEELHPGEPVFIIMHGDSMCGNVHAHCFSPWKWVDLKRHAISEGIRRQDAIDRVCRRWGLSVVERAPGTLNKSQNRTPLSSIRARENKRYSWMDDLKSRIDYATKKATSRDEFEDILKLQNVECRFRGSGVSFSFQDDAGKQRVIRGRRLGTAYMFSRDSDFKTGKTTPSRTASRPAMSAPSIGKGSSPAVTGPAGRISIDKSGMDPVSQAQASAAEASANEALQAQAQAVAEMAQQLSQGR